MGNKGKKTLGFGWQCIPASEERQVFRLTPPFPPCNWPKRPLWEICATTAVSSLSPTPGNLHPFFSCWCRQFIWCAERATHRRRESSPNSSPTNWGAAWLHRPTGSYPCGWETWVGRTWRLELSSEANPIIHHSGRRRCGDNDYFLNIVLFKQPCCGVWRNSGCFCIPGAVGAA